MTLMPKSLLLGIKGFISTPFCVNFSDNILHSFTLINNDLWLFQPYGKLIRSPNVYKIILDPFDFEPESKIGAIADRAYNHFMFE